MKRYLSNPGLKKENMQERLSTSCRGRAFGLMSKFWRRGGIATKQAMTCLSHMLLSPVGFGQIGSGQQHMASAVLRQYTRAL